jgi:DNA topoisomerase-1
MGRLGVDTDGDLPTTSSVGQEEARPGVEVALKDASEVVLATDPDREGESISWHLLKCEAKVPVRRIHFHEITERDPRGARHRRLGRPESRPGAGNAPHSRSALRLHASPVLWKKVQTG